MSQVAERVAAMPRPVALVGFGVEGRDTLRFLLRHGVRDVVVFDRAFGSDSLPAEPEFPGTVFRGGEGWEEALIHFGTVIRSPGVRPDHPALEAARGADVRITSATALFLQACPGRVVGVTGTLGKGTTVSLLGAALDAAGVPCRIGGNIGVNPLTFLDELTPALVVVLELSSFQLMDLGSPHPQVALVLRTTSEHLDWHRDTEEYRAAKRGVLAPPGHGQQVIYCADSEGSRDVIAGHAAGVLAVSRQGEVEDGVGVSGGQVMRFRAGTPERLEALEHLAMPGRFNLENAAAAYLAAEHMGAQPRAVLDAIARFPGLPHRLERVGVVRNVVCYNDSYATRPDASLGAVSSFEHPLSVILGGSEKHADFRPLAEALCAHPSLRRIVLMGTTAERIASEVEIASRRLGRPQPPVARAGSLELAFRMAMDGLPEGGTLLFSPACASFDMFPNYKVRGERFKELVKNGQFC